MYSIHTMTISYLYTNDFRNISKPRLNFSPRGVPAGPEGGGVFTVFVGPSGTFKNS